MSDFLLWWRKLDKFWIKNIGHAATVTVPSVHANPGRAGYYRPWRFVPAEKSGCSRIKEYGKFSKVLVIHLDVRQFPPDGIKCVAEGKSVIVTGKHDEKNDKIGKLTREFTRTYTIPDDIDLTTMTSKLSKTGILKITATKVKDDKTK